MFLALQNSWIALPDSVLTLAHVLLCPGLEGYWMLHMLLASGCGPNVLRVRWMLWGTEGWHLERCLHIQVQAQLNQLYVQCFWCSRHFAKSAVLTATISKLLVCFYSSVSSFLTFPNKLNANLSIQEHKSRRKELFIRGEALLTRVQVFCREEEFKLVAPALSMHMTSVEAHFVSEEHSLCVIQMTTAMTSCLASSHSPKAFHFILLGRVIAFFKSVHEISHIFLVG